ncbi:ribonuclease HII [Candidatus Kaiserbacteria bacterium]|nr:ribonuclease HII [Candidatus Kaiserbacteria bacterium]
MNKKWMVGVDEAGRGPLAGPVAVGAVKVPEDFDWSLLPEVGDSKKLSAGARDVVFNRAKELRYRGLLDFSVAQVGSSVIDSMGIVFAINVAMTRCIKRLQLEPKTCHIKLDGALKAHQRFTQETIIKGDDKEKVIGLASIVAKVTRDKYMKRISRRYPQYGFEEHMGYGTKKHRAQIAKCGKSPIHRVSYCKNIKTL